MVNAGRSGDTTNGGAGRIRDELARHDPDAVIAELGGKDLPSGLDPGTVERNLDYSLTQDRPGLLAGIAEPAMSVNVQGTLAEIWPRLAQRHDTRLFANLYAPLMAPPATEVAWMLLTDRIHASAKGIGGIVPELGPLVEDLITRVETAD